MDDNEMEGIYNLHDTEEDEKGGCCRRTALIIVFVPLFFIGSFVWAVAQMI